MGDNRGNWCRDPFCVWEFPQIRGTISADPIIRTKVFWGLYVGPPILGNYHFEPKKSDFCLWLSEPTPRCNLAPSSTPCLALPHETWGVLSESQVRWQVCGYIGIIRGFWHLYGGFSYGFQVSLRWGRFHLWLTPPVEEVLSQSVHVAFWFLLCP